ncbi:unnamed protein product (macronuclear) [Paramecium tetraurelia]|uniref:Uncharacterized protein n=1 Tax=Paramecium tetraurelia TaxID=5888 RepID=A0C5K3_PARTE|nr:uncharacterized protein GSPATT00035199001 [Paramecium tetraurelia]CAK66070.1 unnamed protein product [Paramecium tetraurelia]|eukprot:XP_001433467.1 hypothetical protein (macronuclear) [Paramecium tetraurelia strain d4-2]
MLSKDQPKENLNKGIVIPLIFQCPKGCVCDSGSPRNWHHKQCGKPSFISEFGDIFCENHQKDCSGYFIKDASFQCGAAKKNNSWYQHKSMSQILMALSAALQAAEQKEQEGVNLEQFTQNIMESVRKRWNN